MIEVYAGLPFSSEVKINYGDAYSTPTAILTSGDDDVPLTVYAGTPTQTHDVWQADIPIDYTEEEQSFSVRWQYTLGPTTSSENYKYEVVTPYITPADIVSLHPELQDKSQAQLKYIESVVRETINAFCNQAFGKREKTISVQGNGSICLRPGERLISLYSLEYSGYTYDYESFGPTDTNWGVKRLGYYDDVIYDPSSDKVFTFKTDVTYSVNGSWGYENVPNAISKAAGILVGDYFCKESAWRDKYLKSMRAADWRIEFDQSAYEGTGNALVDNMLRPYVMERYLLI